MKPLFIVDIDGTICDSADLVFQLNCKFKTYVDNWNDLQRCEFLEKSLECLPIKGSEILNFLGDIIFLTGRSEQIGSLSGRKITSKWLKKAGFRNAELFMRQPNDRRSADIMKVEIFVNKIQPSYSHKDFVFLDDDLNVLRHYAEHGLSLKSPQCWQAMMTTFSGV